MTASNKDSIRGSGGKKSKRKLRKFGFKPQVLANRMPHIMQSSGKGCPIACATMFLNYAGISKSYEDLQSIPSDWKKMNEIQLRGLIESFGLKTVHVKTLKDAKILLQSGKPVIAFVDRNIYAKGGKHWIVLRGVKGNVFIVSDPADKTFRRLEEKTLDKAMKSAKALILFTII
ncbi:MAG: cysteine peptidase family C39 domain-containing protein [Methanosarcinales archaeon]